MDSIRNASRHIVFDRFPILGEAEDFHPLFRIIQAGIAKADQGHALFV
jgi:hypothetical protein